MAAKKTDLRVKNGIFWRTCGRPKVKFKCCSLSQDQRDSPQTKKSTTESLKNWNKTPHFFNSEFNSEKDVKVILADGHNRLTTLFKNRETIKVASSFFH